MVILWKRKKLENVDNSRDELLVGINWVIFLSKYCGIFRLLRYDLR